MQTLYSQIFLLTLKLMILKYSNNSIVNFTQIALLIINFLLYKMNKEAKIKTSQSELSLFTRISISQGIFIRKGNFNRHRSKSLGYKEALDIKKQQI